MTTSVGRGYFDPHVVFKQFVLLSDCCNIGRKIESIWNDCREKIEAFFMQVIRPCRALYQKIFFSAAAAPRVIQMHATPVPLVMQREYWGLRGDKWKEGIDGCHHSYGREVYDRGLHGGAVEPGYLASLERAFKYVGGRLGRPTTADFYLKLHKVACGHFRGAAGGTLMGQEKVGVFRGTDDAISCNFSGVYEMDPSKKEEITALGLGHFEGQRLIYTTFTREQVRARLEGFLQDYHAEIRVARTRREKLSAIAKFTQRCEWLHPPRDGCGRTDMLILNKHLIENGFHPVILEHPYQTNTLSIERCVDLLERGLQAWEIARNALV